VLLGLVAISALLSSGPSQALAADAASSRTSAAADLFARFCSQCHGLNGRGEAGRVSAPAIPDFTIRAWQQSRSNVQLTVSILEGKNQQMPANRGLVSDELARELVAHVRKFAPTPQPAPVKGAPDSGRTTADLIAGRENIDIAGGAARPRTTAAPAYTPTGDFEVDFDNLAKQFEFYQRQAQELTSAPVTGSTPPTSAPPTPASAALVPPTTSPPETAPPVNASPANQPESGQAKPRVASVPVSDRPFTPGDVARGRELFLGLRRLANGGPACITCHAVNRGEGRDGGRLGPDLTKSYERLGGRAALSAHLWAPATSLMRSAYQRHGLDSDEVLSLAAYLEDTDQQCAEGNSPLPVKLLLLGLAGTVLGLSTLGALWGSRSRRRDGAALNGTSAAALPFGRREPAASPADCIGAGL